MRHYPNWSRCIYKKRDCVWSKNRKLGQNVWTTPLTEFICRQNRSHSQQSGHGFSVAQEISLTEVTTVALFLLVLCVSQHQSISSSPLYSKLTAINKIGIKVSFVLCVYGHFSIIDSYFHYPPTWVWPPANLNQISSILCDAVIFGMYIFLLAALRPGARELFN